MPEPIVHVVHCIDAEGPLTETLEATFLRLEASFGISLAPSEKNLEQIRRKQLDLNGWEDAAARMVAPELLDYNDTWEAIESNYRFCSDPAFRAAHSDSFGNGWVYNWYCMDHVGFEANPRQRDFGFHKVFDFYRNMIEADGAPDGIHFHFHPIPFSKAAHHRATHFFAQDNTLYQILARRIIDRHWFPCSYRPGFNATRPDSHWFLEQFIPFDFANQAMDEPDVSQADRRQGRFVDWRRAPCNWQPYHPAHDDYQVEGNCRRFIARCLNIGTRARLLRQADVDQAFQEAAEGKPVVLSFIDHDFRRIHTDVSEVQAMLESAAERHPGVSFRHSESRQAMQHAMGLSSKGLELSLTLDGKLLLIDADSDTFGPQPFLAIKTKSGNYLHDNCDFQHPHREWSYTFDEESIPLEEVETVGVAACTPAGEVCVTTLDVHERSTQITQL